VDLGSEVSVQIVASGHELTKPYIRHDDPLTSAQSLTTGRLRSRAYPLPTLGGFLTEPTVAQQQKFSADSTLGVELLDAPEICMQNCLRCIKDLFVQLSRAVGAYQLRGDVLKALRSVQLCRQLLLVRPQRFICRFERKCTLL